MIYLICVAGIGFGFGVGWLTRGYQDAEVFDHLEADLAAARRAARKRDLDAQNRWPELRKDAK